MLKIEKFLVYLPIKDKVDARTFMQKGSIEAIKHEVREALKANHEVEAVVKAVEYQVKEDGGLEVVNHEVGQAKLEAKVIDGERKVEACPGFSARCPQVRV